MLGYLNFIVNSSDLCSPHTGLRHFQQMSCFILVAASLNLALPPFWCLLQALLLLLTGTLCQLPCCPLSLHELHSQLLCQYLHELPLGYFAAGALLEDNVGIDLSQVKGVTEYSLWPSTCTPFYRLHPCHLI